MCSFLIRDKNAEARDQNQFKYRRTNSVFNPADGKYIIRSDVEAIRAGQRSFWIDGPHPITFKPKTVYDGGPKPVFKTVNWSGGADANRKEPPRSTVHREPAKPVFKTVNWSGGANPMRKESPRGTVHYD
ncbi:uncharacterized protein BKA55DRAFT_272026 [Fusarium redolens]|uniref:Uncharacterized protein n=1 Tax=Fusarium redolens TaxID=48865 RepID=A0A9P9HP80_FUSRE|nr:uncharacterized protein BKA55DRAFT_272026 [Fusarium redolens]KAH7260956.1 hypothetical protein BKA55DRAFT_272026 [Fusarium redolens]